MRDTLYILLRDPGPDGRLEFALDGSATPGRPGVDHAEPGPLLDIAARCRVILIAPAADVRLATIQIPARQLQKAMQAAPYALEDQLAEDVETLHFGVAARLPNGTHPVAVVSRERMEHWLAPFRARGILPDHLLPESLCLPIPAENEWVAVASLSPSGTAQLTVRTGACAGFSCALEDLPGYLQLADPDGQIRLSIFVTDGVDHDFTRLERPVELRPGHRHPLEVLASQAGGTGVLDLLQGSYAQTQGLGSHLRPWKAALVLAGVWCAAMLATVALQAWQLGRELEAQDLQNRERFLQLYPTETRIVDLAAQTEQKLAALRGGAQAAPWFESLDVLTAALSANPGLEIRSIQFREGALYLHLTGSDLQAFESMRLWFERRPDARLSDVQANSGTDGVQVRFKLQLST